MSTMTELARHALKHKYKVVGIGMQQIDTTAFSSLFHFHENGNIREAIQLPQTCVILDVMDTLSSAQSISSAAAVVKNLEDIQSELDLSSGCLALSSRDLDQTCLIYPPSSPIVLDVEQFYSADVALLLRTVFRPAHSLIQWLDYTEANIQKNRIINQLPPTAPNTRKKI